jgi:hypothetical protein
MPLVVNSSALKSANHFIHPSHIARPAFPVNRRFAGEIPLQAEWNAYSAGRVDLRVDRGRFKNHMIFWEAPVPTADDTEGRPSHEQQATRPPRASINAFGTDRG